MSVHFLLMQKPGNHVLEKDRERERQGKKVNLENRSQTWMDIMFVCSSNRLCFEDLLLSVKMQLYLKIAADSEIVFVSKSFREHHTHTSAKQDAFHLIPCRSSDRFRRSHAESRTVDLKSLKRLVADRIYRRKGSGKSRSDEFHLWAGSVARVQVFRVTDHLTR